MLKLSLFLCAAVVTTGCSSISSKNVPGISAELISDSDYYAIVDQQTLRDERYDGLTNVLTLSATLLSTELSLAQVDHNARIYQYNESQYQNERGTIKSNLAKQTEMFVSLFVPDKKQDDLAKKNSMWRIFLDIAGQRYEAKVTKIKTQAASLHDLYPEYNRWSTPYRLVFNVPTIMCDTGHPKLIVTSPVTSSTLGF